MAMRAATDSAGRSHITLASLLGMTVGLLSSNFTDMSMFAKNEVKSVEEYLCWYRIIARTILSFSTLLFKKQFQSLHLILLLT